MINSLKVLIINKTDSISGTHIIMAQLKRHTTHEEMHASASIVWHQGVQGESHLA